MNGGDKKHYEEDPIVRSLDGRGSEFAAIVEQWLTRRELLGTGLAAGFILATGGLARTAMASSTKRSPTGLDFEPIRPSTGDTIIVPKNYRTQTVVRWGDPFESKMPTFAPSSLDASYQRRAFGYNNDFLGYMPLPHGSQNSSHGLLAVNFEYVNPEMMFPVEDPKKLTREQVEVCMEAVGFGTIEIESRRGSWRVVQDSPYNQKWSATSELQLSGPASGNDRMKTSKHKDGTTCTGTLGNCSAGKTPWGTVLSAEENFQSLFGHASTVEEPKAKRSLKRYGIGDDESEYAWERHVGRFDARQEPNESNHFGWIVEFDPYDPDWTPIKRTALGRCRHEAATTYVTKEGRVVMYSGDDARFEYVYKFVASEQYDSADRKANRGLLDKGTLYVAKFNSDGTGEWLPLVHGKGPLTEANGFNDQGDVVIDARIAGDFLGATKMDRPEDIEVNPVNKKVYIVCTNNVDRGKQDKPGTDKANPRPENKHGHIIELTEAGDDHAATMFTWDLFLVCGDPAEPSTFYAGYPKEKVSPISCPDNICFDQAGNLWIATDGQEKALRYRDGFFAVPTEGSDRGKLKQFMAGVVGCEVCGPEFTPDGKTAFLAIQHPGEDSSYEKPSTHWPDGEGVPRPSVIAIQEQSGGLIGS